MHFYQQSSLFLFSSFFILKKSVLLKDGYEGFSSVFMQNNYFISKIRKEVVFPVRDPEVLNGVCTETGRKQRFIAGNSHLWLVEAETSTEGRSWPPRNYVL